MIQYATILGLGLILLDNGGDVVRLADVLVAVAGAGVRVRPIRRTDHDGLAGARVAVGNGLATGLALVRACLRQTVVRGARVTVRSSRLSLATGAGVAGCRQRGGLRAQMQRRARGGRGERAQQGGRGRGGRLCG